MPEGNRKHVFISHHHADDKAVTGLTSLLARKGYDIRNSSIRAKPANQERLNKGLIKDAVLKRLLRMKISWSGTVVVLIGKETHQRPWVNWEIQQAHEQGKRIVGVYERGGTAADIPENLEKYGSGIAAWNSDSIIAAIEGTMTEFQSPDGTARPPVHSGANTVC